MTIRASKRYSKIALVLLSLTLFGFLSFSFVLNSQAAVKIVSTIPAKGEYLDYSGDVVQVRLQADSKVKADGSTIQITREDGIDKDVPVPTIAIDPGNPNIAFVTLGSRNTLGTNKYTVNYSIIGEADGEAATGNFEFYIKPQPSSPLDVGYIFSTPTSAFTSDWKGYKYPPLSTAFFILVTLGALIGNFFFFYGKYFFKQNRLRYTQVNKVSRAVAIVCSIGLGFFLCRITNLQPFNARFFLYLTLVIGVVFLFRGLGWTFRTYPKARAEWNETQSKARRKEEREEEVRREKAERKQVPTSTIPAAVAKSKMNPSADADGEEGDDGDESGEKELPAGTDFARGLSTRGDKRRARKRTKR